MLVTPKQMQMLEKLTDESGVSYAEMMERAGHALADFLIQNYGDCESFLFLAGNGNNGGDCYVAAYYLNFYHKQIQILAPMGEPKTEISQNARDRAIKAGIMIKSEPDSFLENAEVLIDGIFGTGFRGELPQKIQELFSGHEDQIRIACDIPSGGNGATGAVSAGSFAAYDTVTFGAEKIGMSQYPLRKYCGEIHVADIGIPKNAFQKIEPVHRLQLSEIRENLPYRQPDAYKNQFGHVLAVAGSVRMRGACILAVTAAMHSGAGLLTCASAEQVLTAVSITLPEAMCLPLQTDKDGFFLNTENHEILAQALKNKQACVIGCGMGVTESTRNLIKFLFSNSSCPIILDADGLNAIAGCIELIPEGRTILTPHMGEAARLLKTEVSEIQKDRISAARKLAEITKAVVILKGAGTIVTDGLQTAVCNLGNAGMARAGSGDVLAGITGAFAAQGLGLYQAACTAVTVHAAAGDAAAESLPDRYMLPQDLIRSLKDIL